MSALRARTAMAPATAAVTAAAVVGAVVLGVLLAQRFTLGAGAAAGVLYLAVALRSPAAAVALWIPSFFLAFLPGGNQLLQAGFVVAALALVAAHLRRGADERADLVTAQRAFAVVVLLLSAWVALSVVWARDPGAAVTGLFLAGLAVFVALAVVGVCTQERHALWLAAAFVGGATVSALLGLLGGEAIREFDASFRSTDRVAGGAGDANQLAASIIPAMALALGVMTAAPSRAVRFAAAASIPIGGVALAATQSRGGLISFALMVVLVLIAFPAARGAASALMASAAVAIAIFLVANPAALERVTTTDTEGTGRTDLWRVGMRMAADHPFGVGQDNFRLTSADYALSPGNIERIRHIVDTPLVAHNTFIQVLTETGFIGLGLYFAVIGVSLAMTRRAIRLFERAGRAGMANLGRATLIALISLLASSFFVSFAYSYRMWVLLALGPALLTVAVRGARGASGAHVPATR